MGGMKDLFGDLPYAPPGAAKAARDAALERVTRHSGDWLPQAKLAVSLLRGWEGTAEALRFHLVRTGLEPPHHHNAWGGLINSCMKSGILRPCDPPRYVSMTGVKSHARKSQVLRTR